MLTEEQKRFEKIHCGGNLNATRKNTTTGDYVLPSVQDAWSGWCSAIEAGGRAEAQEPVGVFADVNRRNDQPALWEQMVPSAYDGKEYIYLYAAPQPPAPCPKCAEAERIEAIAAANLGEEIIKNGTLQDRLAQLECDFALEHDDKLELQVKIAELEALRAQDAKAYERLDELRNRDFETIAQQAERIAEIEKRDRQMAKRLKAYQQAWDAKDLHNQLSAIVFEEAHGVAFELAYSQQSALIEKCRVGFLKMKHKKNDARLLDIIADAHLAAIAAPDQPVDHHHKSPDTNGSGEKSGDLSTTVDVQKVGAA